MTCCGVVLACAVFVILNVTWAQDSRRGRGRHGQREETLIQRLSGVDRILKPRGNSNGTVNVIMDVSLKRIVDFDLERQVLTLDAWISYTWQDSRLTWDNREIPVDYTVMPVEAIWTPDIMLYNNAGEGPGIINSVSTTVAHDGTVFYVVPSRLQAYCPTELTPTGPVTCTLKFGSWNYNGAEINLEHRHGSNGADLSNFQAFNRKWILVRNSAVKNEISYACCPETYQDITFTLTLEDQAQSRQGHA